MTAPAPHGRHEAPDEATADDDPTPGRHETPEPDPQEDQQP